MNAGQRSFQENELDRAVQAFRQATKLFPKRVEGWINLGSALHETEHYDAAVTALEKAVSKNPKISIAHLILGDALRMLGRWSEALDCYKTGVALERSPLSLNKLACALRTNKDKEGAEDLYREAIEMDPNFSLVRLNLATLQIEFNRFDDAAEQLHALADLRLPEMERRELSSTMLTLSEHARLKQAIGDLAGKDDPAPLEEALRNTPKTLTKLDTELLKSIERYAESAQRLSWEPVAIDDELPAEWPEIEGIFMIPYANSIDEYFAAKEELKTKGAVEGDLLESANMEAVIRAARICSSDMRDPIKAELHLRHWHLLACSGLPGYSPGHFKYMQNGNPSDPTRRRVEPAYASATFRHFVSEIYSKLEPGYARGAVVHMAVADLHVFMDGNHRTGSTWLNRELEWAGLMPTLFQRKLGLKGQLGAAMSEVRSNGGDISPLISVILAGQQFACMFCAELRDRTNGISQ